MGALLFESRGNPHSELIREIRVTASAPFQRFTLFSLAIPEVPAGSIVHAMSQFEVTNDCGVNVMLVQFMMVHDRDVRYRGEVETAGRLVHPARLAGENVTPGMHHGYRSLSGAFESDGRALWISVVAYAASKRISADQTIEVMGGYGGLSAIVHRS
jgi:hypothetical protein